MRTLSFLALLLAARADAEETCGDKPKADLCVLGPSSPQARLFKRLPVDNGPPDDKIVRGVFAAVRNLPPGLKGCLRGVGFGTASDGTGGDTIGPFAVFNAALIDKLGRFPAYLNRVVAHEAAHCFAWAAQTTWAPQELLVWMNDDYLRFSARAKARLQIDNALSFLDYWRELQATRAAIEGAKYAPGTPQRCKWEPALVASGFASCYGAGQLEGSSDEDDIAEWVSSVMFPGATGSPGIESGACELLRSSSTDNLKPVAIALVKVEVLRQAGVLEQRDVARCWPRGLTGPAGVRLTRERTLPNSTSEVVRQLEVLDERLLAGWNGVKVNKPRLYFGGSGLVTGDDAARPWKIRSFLKPPRGLLPSGLVGVFKVASPTPNRPQEGVLDAANRVLDNETTIVMERDVPREDRAYVRLAQSGYVVVWENSTKRFEGAFLEVEMMDNLDVVRGVAATGPRPAMRYVYPFSTFCIPREGACPGGTD